MSETLSPFVTDLAEKGLTQSADYVQLTSSLVAKTEGSIAETSYIGCMTALGAITTTAMMVANKPKLTNEEIRERGHEEAAKLINSDTILFVALLVAKMQRDHKFLAADKSGRTGVEGRIAWGPNVFRSTLDEWERVTGKNADGILDKRLVEAARKAEPLEGPDPFQKWLEERKTKNPSDDANVIKFPSSETKH